VDLANPISGKHAGIWHDVQQWVGVRSDSLWYQTFYSMCVAFRWTVVLLLLLRLRLHSVVSQALQDPGIWTFVRGSQNQYNTAAVWGTLGLPSLTNTPPALVGPCADRDQYAQSVIYMFGGQSQSPSAYYSAIWKLNMSSAGNSVIWTWIAGPSTANMVSNNSTSSGYPSSRAYCSMVAISVGLAGTWTPSSSSSTFFLFGGMGVVNANTNGMFSFVIDSFEYLTHFLRFFE
jgi:hypothetical protein